MCQCLAILGRIFIGILSFIFTIIGVAVLAAGVMVKVQSPFISGLFDTALKTAQEQIAKLTSNPTTLPEINLDEVIGGLALAFIVLGLVMMVIGIFGLVGACCMIKCMVICYMVIVGLLFVSQLALVLILVLNRGLILDYPRNGLKTTLQQEYQGLDGQDVTSLTLNLVMMQLQCCGIDDYKDFAEATKWQTKYGTPNGYQAPIACCKPGEFTAPATGDVCARIPSDSNSNYKKGCFDTLLNFIFKGDTFIMFACADVGGLFLLTFFSAVILFDIIKKDNKVGP